MMKYAKKIASVCASIAVVVAICACSDEKEADNDEMSVSRETFDFDWKFAKFGKFDDCVAKEEPGAPAKLGTASSQEEKNPAWHAFDGDPETRWCAAGRIPASLTIDLGRVREVGSSKIIWEQQANYRYKISVSDDGENWEVLVDRSEKNAPEKENTDSLSSRAFRYAKIDVQPAGNAWPSICEWTFFSGAGAKVVPEVSGDNGKKAYDIDFDDFTWRAIDLPHDWGVESRFLPSEPNQTASLPWNAVGWYRKEFFVPEEKAGKKFYIDFDGVMMTPKVYVNGKLAGEWAYGYSSFRVDITPFLKFGEKNLVAVRAENLPDSTRWYPGAGIYRHTWLVEKNPVHIATWGVYVTTPTISGIQKIDGKFFATDAEISVATEVENDCGGNNAPAITISQKIVRDGKDVCTLAQNGAGVATGSIKNAELWDVENPALYTLVTEVFAGDKLVDREETVFGIRKIEWKPDGFYLNNRRLQIKGVCQHHDLGPLGSAVHERAIERQIEILKSFGVNAIRTSHNPPAPELLKLCDRMGVLVDDELFDCWKYLKEGKKNGYNLFWNDWRERDVANFIRRDRNHPSVVIWSLGNEIEEQGRSDGPALARELSTLVKSHDKTRPVAAGCNDLAASWNGFGNELDVYGFNYKPNNYTDFANKNPGKPFFGTETSSCVSTRGFYSFPQDGDFEKFWKRNFCDNLAICQVSDYGIYAPGWAYAPDVEFAALEDEPRVAGEFVWCGFDYLGEPTPWNLGRKPANDFRGASPEEIAKLKAEMEEILKQGTPSRSSYFGIVDLCGFRKDRAYLYQSHWLPDVPMAHILPHWNWQGSRDGLPTPVMVYTSGDSAELFLNGKSLGKRVKKAGAKLTGKDLNGDLRERFRLVWMDVKYEPGTLEVVAYKNGKEWARDKVETTGVPTTFTLEADRDTICGDGRDLSYITVSVRDDKGRVVPTATNLFKFSATGSAEIVGICNGDPTDHRSMKGSEMPAFAGLAQVVVRGRRDCSGPAEIVVDGGDLGTQKLVLTVAPQQ
ncbi:MAG: DUF4982 domain-containing protein [Opitutae bacterium]|nr:DUF4982 domain-containing protein [Opitutae bacterium]